MKKFFIFLISLIGTFLLALVLEKYDIGSDMNPPSQIQSEVSGRVEKILADTEVKATLARIETDRPKFQRDGVVFQNRERRLPVKDR